MDWNDLRYVLAIARGGGLNAAARTLGVDPSSVFRRLGALEAQLEVRLFERLRAGYRLTPAGEALAETAARVEEETTRAERNLKGIDTRLEGHIRLHTSDVVAQHLLTRHLADFRDTYPGLSLAIATSADYVDLSRREVDVVIRATPAPPEHLVGRRSAQIGIAAYASQRYLDRAGRGRGWAEYEWLDFEGPMQRAPMAQWMADHVGERAVRFRFDVFATLRHALVDGLGCAVLPCFAGDGDPALERLPGTRALTPSYLWVLTHPDLRRSARIHAFMQFFGTRLAGDAALLEGAPDRPPGRTTPARNPRRAQPG